MFFYRVVAVIALMAAFLGIGPAMANAKEVRTVDGTNKTVVRLCIENGCAWYARSLCFRNGFAHGRFDGKAKGNTGIWVKCRRPFAELKGRKNPKWEVVTFKTLSKSDAAHCEATGCKKIVEKKCGGLDYRVSQGFFQSASDVQQLLVARCLKKSWPLYCDPRTPCSKK